MIKPRALALSLAIWAPPGLSLAQTPTGAEIAEIRAQIQVLTARLNALESQAASAAVLTIPVAVAPRAIAPPAAAAARPEGRTGTGHVNLTPAPLDRPLQGDGSKIEFKAASDSSEVSLKLSAGWTGVDLGEKSKGWMVDSGWNLTLSAPLAKGQDSTTVATLDKLSSGAAMRLQWAQFRVRVANGAHAPGSLEIANAANAACLKQAAVAGQPAVTCADPKIGDDELYQCRKRATDEGKPVTVCPPDFNSGFVRKYNPTQYAEYKGSVFPRSPAYGYGLEGGVGYQAYSFLDVATLTKHDTDRGTVSLKAFGSLFPYSNRSSLTGSLAYQRGFTAAKSGTLCPVTAGAAILRCETGAIGKPGKDNSYLVALEGRRLFKTPNLIFGKSVGVSLQATYDLDGHDSGFDLPIYFVPNDKGDLLGGIRLGYTTREDQVTVGVFVSTAFSLDGAGQ